MHLAAKRCRRSLMAAAKQASACAGMHHLGRFQAFNESVSESSETRACGMSARKGFRHLVAVLCCAVPSSPEWLCDQALSTLLLLLVYVRNSKCSISVNMLENLLQQATKSCRDVAIGVRGYPASSACKHVAATALHGFPRLSAKLTHDAAGCIYAAATADASKSCSTAAGGLRAVWHAFAWNVAGCWSCDAAAAPAGSAVPRTAVDATAEGPVWTARRRADEPQHPSAAQCISNGTAAGP